MIKSIDIAAQYRSSVKVLRARIKELEKEAENPCLKPLDKFRIEAKIYRLKQIISDMRSTALQLERKNRKEDVDVNSVSQ